MLSSYNASFSAGSSCVMPNKMKKGFRRHSNGTTMSSPPQNNGKAVRKQWTDQQMQAAIDDATGNHLGANAAAKKHGVPPSTLKDRPSG